jgi:hypothetical protein
LEVNSLGIHIWCGTGGARSLCAYKKYLSAEAGVLSSCSRGSDGMILEDRLRGT